MRNLSIRQERFCHEYVIDRKGGPAYGRAFGRNRPTAADYRSAQEYLSKPLIQKRVAELEAERTRRVELEADAVLRELMRVAFSDITEVMAWDARSVTLRPSVDLDPESAAAVASVRARSEARRDNGGTTHTVIELDVRMHNKVAALERLAEHLGLFDRT